MAKVIFASGIFIIIGVYTLSLQTADQASYRVAKAQALQNQASQIALAGINFARVDLASIEHPSPLPYTQTENHLGGTLTYRIESYAAAQLRVISNGAYPASDSLPQRVGYISLLSWQDNRWKVTRMYKTSPADGYKGLN